MSDSRNEEELDLSNLQMVPDWVADLDSGRGTKAFQDFKGDDRGRDDRRGGRPPKGRGDRQDRRPGPPRDRDRDRGPKPGGRDRRKPHPGGDRRQGGRGRGPERRPAEVKGIKAEVQPSERTVAALVQQIRTSGRIFGLFDLAKLIMAGRDRYEVRFIREDSAPDHVQLVRCPHDGSLWLSKEEAIRHFLSSREGIEAFYAVEETEVEPPKGNFNAIAVCGMSGELLGPPNHHSYQTAVVRLHRKRFANMPIEKFKARIRTETGEEIVEKWKETQSKVVHYLYPKEPAEAEEQERLESQEALERHVSSKLGDRICEVAPQAATVPGDIPGRCLSPALLNLLRSETDSLRYSPFPLVKKLCSRFEKNGLKIFKREGKKLFVSKVRPRGLDPNTPLSDSVLRIIDAVQAQRGIKVSQLVVSLAPRREKPAEPAKKEGAEESGEPAEKPKKVSLTPEETSVLSDLHWLIDEGYILEYPSGALFLGGSRKPQPKAGPKKETKAKEKTPATESTQPPANAETAEQTPSPAEAAPASGEKIEEASSAPAPAPETAATDEEAQAEEKEKAPATESSETSPEVNPEESQTPAESAASEDDEPGEAAPRV